MKTIHAFLLGMYEFRMSFTFYLRHPDLMRVYSQGRAFAHALTFRRFTKSDDYKSIALLHYSKLKK